MTAASRCPRCLALLRPPGLMSSDWVCPTHGAVHPFWTLHACDEALTLLSAAAQVPLWVPLPLLPGWSVTGLARAGDERTGARATVMALAGPSPLGGPADLLLIAEEPGLGLGARFAGHGSPEPGDCTSGPPDAKVEAAGHPTALWRCGAAPDRAAFVGEASGVWLGAVLWPAEAELILLEHVELHDLRHDVHAGERLPIGAPSPHLH